MTLSVASISYAIFFSCFVIQAIFWLFRISAFVFKKQEKKSQKITYTPFSIIIAAKNEYKNLQKLIPLLLEQKGKDVDIIIANDCSTDQSTELLNNYSQQYPQLHHISITEVPSGVNSKKHALTLAIEKAKHEKLIFTDADCLPSSNEWASTMTSKLNATAELVLGLSPYEKRKGLLNSLIRLETIFTAINYISFALWRSPYMGVGRNLAYTKSSFNRSNGFKNMAHITGGDDDLLVQKIAEKRNTAVCLDTEAQCISLPKDNLLAWAKQKKRHYGVGQYYSRKFKLILGIDTSSQLFLIFSFLIHLIFGNIKIEMIICSLLGLFLTSIFVYSTSIKSGFKVSFPELFILSPFTKVFLTGIGCYSFFSKHSSRWN